jgi:hypothetical protein
MCRPTGNHAMNDAQIRLNFHRKKLRRLHTAADTLVLDELGLKHGKCRADIAVINGHLIGFEIKSDEDSLSRLDRQVAIYNAVFDYATVIVAQRHLESVRALTPDWWGITVATKGQRGAIHFETVRRPKRNPSPDDFAVAQLLWRNEAEEELLKHGVSAQILRQKRSILYRELVEILAPRQLRKTVRERLKSRTDWRCLSRPSPSGDSCRPCAT